MSDKPGDAGIRHIPLEDPALGISMRFIKEYDISTKHPPTRFDAFIAQPRLPWWTRLRLWLGYYTPEQLMRRYLQRKGWVVFWLDEQCRHCGPSNAQADTCWLRLYEDGRKAGRA